MQLTKIISDDVFMQFDLLMMSTMMFETCRGVINKYIKSASSWSLAKNCINSVKIFGPTVKI